jgi:hypothetical protein
MIFKISYLRRKIKIAIKKTFDPNYKSGTINSTESKAYLICHRLIVDPNSTLMMAPLSGKKYVKQSDGKLFIMIWDWGLTIINHKYSYDITLPNRLLFKLVKTFDNSLEDRRLMMEKEILGNVHNSLDKIRKEIISG